jgi:hypothetical protein
MRWILLVLALAVLNVSLAFSNVWPTLFVWWNGELSIELAVLLAGLVLAHQRIAPVSARARRWLAVLWVGLIVGRYVDVTLQALYWRPIDLYWDLGLAPDVGAMFAVVANPWLAMSGLFVVVACPVLLFVLISSSLGRVLDALNHRRARLLLGGAAVVTLVFALGSRLGAPVSMVRFTSPVVPAYARAVGSLVYELAGGDQRPLPSPPEMRSNLQRLGGADVFLMFLESYGAVSWDRPEFARSLSASRELLEEDIRATGRAAVSGLIESTTFGGESWLSHISLLSGTGVRDQRTYMRLMDEQRDTLVKIFGRRGYRTVAIMPGLQGEWPQGGFYGFDDIYGYDRLDYRERPSFGWFGVTDQFALARIDDLEVGRQPPRRPLFVFFPTISTHAPFTPAPPYQADWARVLTDDPYDADPLTEAWAEKPDWMDLGPSYVRSLIYAHQTIGGYLRLRADRDFVLILVGDHQPPGLISGPEASWDVPVHVIASRGGLLDRLRQHGFRDGLAPGGSVVARMDRLLLILLDAFGDDEEVQEVHGSSR